jgi:lycopene beta-cyclase
MALEMWQTFLAWEVRTESARFEPGAATLMDFRIAQEEGLCYLSVLPYATDHALVTHATIGRGRVARHKRERELRNQLGESYEIVRSERGRLPMTTARIRALRSPGTTGIGIAGGALRPASRASRRTARRSRVRSSTARSSRRARAGAGGRCSTASSSTRSPSSRRPRRSTSGRSWSAFRATSSPVS